MEPKLIREGWSGCLHLERFALYFGTYKPPILALETHGTEIGQDILNFMAKLPD